MPFPPQMRELEKPLLILCQCAVEESTEFQIRQAARLRSDQTAVLVRRLENQKLLASERKTEMHVKRTKFYRTTDLGRRIIQELIVVHRFIYGTYWGGGGLFRDKRMREVAELEFQAYHRNPLPLTNEMRYVPPKYCDTFRGQPRFWSPKDWHERHEPLG